MQCLVLPQSKKMEVNKKQPQHTFNHTSMMDRRKNSATTHAHMLVLDQFLMEKQNKLIEGGTIFDNTYGCAKQYQFSTDLHLISIFCANNYFCIYQAIGAPGNGKYLVDSLNECDKQHLKQYTKRINQPHEGDEDINIKPYLIYIKNSLAC